MRKPSKRKTENAAITLLPSSLQQQESLGKRTLLCGALCSLLCCALNLAAGIFFGMPQNQAFALLLAVILPYAIIYLYRLLGRDFASIMLLLLLTFVLLLQSDAFSNGFYARMNEYYAAVNSTDTEYFVPYSVSGSLYTKILYTLCTQLLLAGVIGFILYKPVISANRAFVGRRQLSAYGKGNILKGALPYFAAVCILVAAGCILLPMDKADSFAADLREDIKTELYSGNIEYAKLPYGNLQGYSTPQYSESVIFKATMEIPSDLYLPVFIGSDYDDGIWSYDTENQYTGLWQWLNQNRFYPMISFGSYLCGLEGAYVSTVQMENYALHSDSLLLPYQTVYTFVEESFGDEPLASQKILGQREYTFDYVDMDIDDFAAENLFDLEIYTPKSDDYFNAENAYRAFVYENYLEVPAKYEELLSVCFSPAEYEVLSTAQHHKVVSIFRRYFTDNFTCNDIFTAPQDGSGFLYTFLSNKEGGSYHFATLATLLFRKAGIPARYAEGYALTADEMYMYAQMDNIAFSVTDSSAHAWVEIYLDGIGWLPVEITPGFYRLNDNEEAIDGIQDVLEDKNEYFFIKDVDAEKDEFQEKPKVEKPVEIIPFWQSVWFKILLIVIVLLLILLIIEVARRLRWRKYLKAESNEAALLMYRHLRRAIAMTTNEKNQKALFFCEAKNQLTALLPALPQDKGAEFLRLAFKAKFSEDKLSEQEREEMYQTLVLCCSEIYKKAKFAQRVKMYFKGLKAARRAV